MHKVLVIVIGLAGLGAFVQPALAARNCLQDAGVCYEKLINAGHKLTVSIDVCWSRKQACERDNAGEGYSPNGTKISSEGGGSKPKEVDGKTQRTADGGTVMVTPKGKEWAWNGKYNTVVDYASGYVIRSHSVMQGDPDAPMQKVDGHWIRQSDPGYQAAIDAEIAKKKVVVHDHRTPKPPTTTPTSAPPTKFGTAQGAASGQTASTTNSGSPATNSGGSNVRDHRAGANNATGVPLPPATVPPPVAASVIDKRPGRNAQ